MQDPPDKTRPRPIKSMTGFGRNSVAVDGVEIAVELRAVNHRFLDVSLKLPRTYSAFEPQLRKVVAEYADRGKIDVMVTRYGAHGTIVDVGVDHELAGRYHSCLAELKESLGLSGGITVSDMLNLPDIVTSREKEEAVEKEASTVEACLRGALRALNEMRDIEGEATWRDIETRLNSIKQTASLIPPLAGTVVSAARERLDKRVRELTGGLDLNEERLLQEVALIADRSDISEELNRLGSHVEQFFRIGTEGSPLGRKLEFLLQELHRELNTMGSKCGSTEISSLVVSMKADVEKIREQIQNIE
jgi:uncharacterized protein (TIGR00255 family)